MDKQFEVLVCRNCYGLTEEKKVVIKGESFDRAKFEFNMTHIDWRVISLIKEVHDINPLDRCNWD